MKFPYKKAIATLLSFTLTITGVIPAHAQNVTAPPTCYPDSNTMGGLTPACAAVKKAGVNFAYPKLSWSEVGVIDLAVSTAPGTVKLARPSDNLAATAAADLGLDEKDVIQAVSLFPTNTPIVMGRYSTWDASLSVDIFKLEKTGTKARMLHATFAPEHGDYWKAAGAYGSATDRKAGALGRNPFEAFKSGTGRFVSISAGAAQVALGHAQRMVQAPVSVMAVVNSNIRPVTTKKSCSMGLQKCVTTKYWLDMDTQWYLGMPVTHANPSQSILPAGYCVTAPATAGSSCSASEFATAGVAFVEQVGGTFNSERATDYIGKETKKSWSLLGILVISFVIGFGASALATAGASLGATAGASSGLAGATGVSAGGLLGATAQAVGMIGQFGTYAAAAAMETALTGGILVGLGGADLGSSMRMGTEPFMSSEVRATAAAVNPKDQSNKYVRAGVTMTKSRTVERLDGSIGPVKSTLIGECGFAGKGSDCQGRSTGMVQRADQILQTDRVQLYREADGRLVDTK